MKKVSLLIVVLMTLSLLMGACAPKATESAPVVEEEAEEAPAPTKAATSTVAPVNPTAPPTEAAPEEAEEVEEVEEAAPAEDSAIVIALDSITDQLDPMFSSSLNAAGIYENMFDELLALDENVNLVPSVAVNWDISEDNRTWTFSLRDDVVFWDGTPLTAEDVKYTIDRMTDPEVGATGNTEYLASNMVVENVEVIDDYTVSITTEVPVPAFLYFIQEVQLLSKAYYDGKAIEDTAKTPMGSGPYVFVEFVKDDHVTMEANPDWWGGTPEIKTVTFRKIPEASTRVAELETGGVDIAQSIPVAKFEDVKKLDNATLKNVVSGCRMFFGFKHDLPQFQDKRIRQAMNYAVDWDTINEVFFNGSVPRMVLNVNAPWLNEDLAPYPYDPDKALELFEAAGWTKNADGWLEKDGEIFDPQIMIYYDATSDRYEILLAIIDMYREIGINAEAVPTERSVAIDKLINQTYDEMFFMGSCSSFEGQGDIADLSADSVTNYGNWVNDDFMALFNELGQEFNPEKRAELLDEMQVIVYEEAPQVWLYNLPNDWGVANRLNWDPSPTGRVHVYRSTIVE